MSSFIVSTESIQNIAESIAYCLNYPNSEMGCRINVSELSRELSGTLWCGFYSTPRICRKLYKMNLDAVNSRYKSSERNIPEFKDGVNLITGHHLYKLIKITECYLYQCAEDGVYGSPLYNAVDSFLTSLYRYLIHNTAEYKNLKWE